ncbi:34156_t:CDS:1, partial [Gigaspora margarita]
TTIEKKNTNYDGCYHNDCVANFGRYCKVLLVKVSDAKVLGAKV